MFPIHVNVLKNTTGFINSLETLPFLFDVKELSESHLLSAEKLAST